MDIQTLLAVASIIIGILVSYYFYRKSNLTKEPCYFYDTYREIEKLTSGEKSPIQVMYEGLAVDRVYTTYIWIWNAGRLPILKSDLPSKDYISLRLFDGNNITTILDFQVVKMTRDSIGFVAKEDEPGLLVLEFDFLDTNDGAIIEVQHTGSANTDVLIEGVVLGSPKGFRNIPLINSAGYLFFYPDATFSTNGERAFRKKSGRAKFMLSFFAVLIFAIVQIGSLSLILRFGISDEYRAVVNSVVLVALFAFELQILRETLLVERYPFPKSLEYDSTPQ